ncbi:hypothetical protein EAD98_23110, partial [Micromonospora sp. CV4]
MTVLLAQRGVGVRARFPAASGGGAASGVHRCDGGTDVGRGGELTGGGAAGGGTTSAGTGGRVGVGAG